MKKSEPRSKRKSKAVAKPKLKVVAKPRVKTTVVKLPVFTGHDPVGEVATMAVAGARELRIVSQSDALKKAPVPNMPSLESISNKFTLEQLLEVLKIKMYNESISDQTVYDLLFEDRLKNKTFKLLSKVKNRLR